MGNPNALLDGTPYLIPEDPRSLASFDRIAAKSLSIAEQARAVSARISSQADDLLQPFLRYQRSDLVAESNQIEGYPVSQRHVLEAIEAHRELMDTDVHKLMEAMRADPKIVNALGLYKAQEIADEWAHAGRKPQRYEVRQLHALLVVDERYAGKYRTADVAIGGTTFRPPAHFDVPQAMDNFSNWWERDWQDPVLGAAVAHAWLTHIHPYEDGNGRLARILANFALAQADYPPLIVRAGEDRGEYYAALSASDEGNILPLYQLFANIIRRTVKIMRSPSYTQDLLENRLLTSLDDQRGAWCATLHLFGQELAAALSPRGWTVDHQGAPGRESFQLLADRDADGNGWYAVIRDEHRSGQWLLWFGYNSTTLLEYLGGADRTGYPSIFISRRDRRSEAPHPYSPEAIPGVWSEIFLKPLDPSPVTWRDSTGVSLGGAAYAAGELAAQLVAASG